MPLAKILGDIFILRGTDKLIFIQLFFFFLHSYRQDKKNIFFYLIDKIILYFPCSVLACNFCTEIKLFVCASF